AGRYDFGVRWIARLRATVRRAIHSRQPGLPPGGARCSSSVGLSHDCEPCLPKRRRRLAAAGDFAWRRASRRGCYGATPVPLTPHETSVRNTSPPTPPADLPADLAEAPTLPPPVPPASGTETVPPTDAGPLPPCDAPLPPAADGVTVPGYEIVKELGRGGMGV